MDCTQSNIRNTHHELPHRRIHRCVIVIVVLLWLRLFGAARPPAIQVKECALIAFPREFLGPDRHVFGHGTIGTMVVFLDEPVLDHHHKAPGSGDKDGHFDPQPQLGPFFVVRLVGISRHDLLLVGDSCPDLFDGLGLHLGLGTDLGDGLDRTELGACSGNGSRYRAAADRQGASEASGCYQRLCRIE